jgi:Polyketide cyclase / dehydrase and lipid transport
MSRIHIQTEGPVNAPAAEVYALLADYRNGHPLIVPREYFSDLTVEQGGYGAGTIVSFSVKAGGNTHNYRDVVSEPQPGRVLVESDTLSTTVTTFTVTPLNDTQSTVQIATDIESSPGIRGFFEMMIAPRILKGMYDKELKQINDVAVQRHAQAKQE